MKHVMQVVFAGVLVLAVASGAVAQQAPQPVVRLGNFIEVGNEVFMHIIATNRTVYHTVHNFDFESRVRDRTAGRAPGDTNTQNGDGDVLWAELRFGAEFRYQKNLELHLLFEQQQIFDGNLIDDRSNQNNPGGTDVFGRAASTENPGFHIERFWIDYTFPGTPLRMRVGADLWRLDQAGILGDDDPRLALFATFGNLDLTAAVIQRESQRLGLQNDNDFIYYTFSAGYNLKPHRFQVDVAYFRDRFHGADTQSATARPGLTGFLGQKTDSVLIMGSWSGSFATPLGRVRGLLQGNVLTGTARGGTQGIPAGVAPGRDYDILAFGAVAYAEMDLGVVRPFVGLVYGSGDGDPRDNKLHGFAQLPQRDITVMAQTSFFAPLESSVSLGQRDFTCPGRAQGVRTAAPANNPLAVGTAALGGSAATGFAECGHTTFGPFNDRLTHTSHLGINTTYGNPGTLMIPVGLRVFPVKGHEITGWYIYDILDTADSAAPGVVNRSR